MKKLQHALSLVLAAALMCGLLCIPSFAATVESTEYSENFDECYMETYYKVYAMMLELDRDPIAVSLPWSADGRLPYIYVSSGTKILSAIRESHTFWGSEFESSYDQIHSWDYDDGDLNGPTSLYLTNYTGPDGTEIYDGEELAAAFNLPSEDWGSLWVVPILNAALTQEGVYEVGTIDIYGVAFLNVIAPGSEYWDTVLAQPNGIEAKLDVRATGKTTVNYQGQQIPLYSVNPGSLENANMGMRQEDGASYVINTYQAVNSNGTLTDIEADKVNEFIGEEGYYYNWWLGEDFEDVLVCEIIENGVTIQTVALTLEPVSSVGTYVVQAGDTWSSICTNFYGNNAQRVALQKANNYVKLTPGTVITLPDTLGKVSRLPAPVAGAGEKLYTVKLGDTLGSIALAEYGTMSAYKDIFERNTDRIKNVNMIYEGQVIVLPAR